MMPRDESWERLNAVSHADDLRKLLEKGQDLDVEVEGGPYLGTLREFLVSLKREIDRALGS